MIASNELQQILECSANEAFEKLREACVITEKHATKSLHDLSVLLTNQHIDTSDLNQNSSPLNRRRGSTTATTATTSTNITSSGMRNSLKHAKDLHDSIGANIVDMKDIFKKLARNELERIVNEFQAHDPS